jgi:hypothetical protein
LSSPKAPTLSVVIAASNGPEAVARTLASLGRQRLEGAVELVVAAPRDRIVPPDHLPPGVTWVPAEAGAAVPRLRRLGLDRASGDVIVLTEDSCQFDDGWASAWRRAFADPRVLAATGPVVPAMGDRPLDWAVFFCEYAAFLPAPAPGEGRSLRLAGNNFAVRRSLADRLDPCTIEETDVPGVAGCCGDRIALAIGAVAGHARRYGLAEAVGDRLRFGRSYGRRRATTLPTAARFAGLVAGPAILLAQVARLTLTVARQPRHAGRFAEVLPLTLGLLTAWSVGEWLGWAEAAVRPPASRRRRETTGRPGARPNGRSAWKRRRCTPGPRAA